MTIKKILIANRGEIACRIIRTCKVLGIATVAVYSEADARAMHVQMADEAVCVGPAAARESYLNVQNILMGAKKTGADAVHPGYGFLSENAEFAESCAKAGLIFIGPPPSAIRAMGGKSAAKALMEKAGVPLVPGYHGNDQDEKLLQKQAEKIGFPVLIKASAGGGGKGMRIVDRVGDFADALTGAKREAKASFGNDHVLVEKYLAAPRHVEIQVFADIKGNCVYLFERDCSVQRRHQKVIEEAPAPHMQQKIREKMGKAAVAAAKAIDYVGAGTVEFLLDGDDFYFMEMNTRLQVEHPVTEMITGLDLVALQIHVAEGKLLPFAQKDLKIHGHAFEARLYAEDPDNNFLPGAGHLRYLSFVPGTRVDTGVRQGDDISIHYDPMIAKIITHGATREEALHKMSVALDNTHAAGPKTNLSFLRRLVRHAAFTAGDVSTKFIDTYRADLLPQKTAPSDMTLKIAARSLVSVSISSDPWSEVNGWRIGGSEVQTYTFKDDMGEYTVAQTVGDVPPHTVLRDGNRVIVMYEGVYAELTYVDPLHAGEEMDDKAHRLTAPMPGKVVAVPALEGVAVKKGQPLVIIEAMKMEHTITAPFDGVIANVYTGVGDYVDEKKELVAFQ